MFLAGVALLVALTGVFVTLASSREWTNDDAYITFRYASHLAAGHGIVWNLVEPRRVEGSTSLGWTLANAAAVRFGRDPDAFSHVLGLIAGALVLVLAWVGACRTLGLGPLWALAAPGLLCAQRQHVLWSVSGMETSTAALLSLAATLLLLHEDGASPGGVPGEGQGNASGAGSVGVRGRRLGAGPGSGLLFFLGTHFRPETPLLHLAAGVGLVGARRTRHTLRLVAVSGLVHAAGLAALTAWRLAYFGQALPNPFYVKVGGLQLERGMRFLAEFGLQNHAWLWGGAILLAVPRLWRRARVPFAVLAAQLAAWCAWLAAIGGDVWEFRFLVPVLPVLALLFALALAQLEPARPRTTPAARAHPTAGGAPGRPSTARFRRAVAVTAGVTVLLSQLHVLRSGFRSYADAFSVDDLARGAEYVGREAASLSRYLGAEDRICTGWAGAIPYFTGAWHLDPWGLNAAEIARRPLDPAAVLYHQRHAAWSDVVANRVMFCDVFNHFLFPYAFDPRAPRNVVPWVEPGVPVFSVRLPEGHHWLFTSARPRAEVESWLASRGLGLESVIPLPGGWPRLGE